MTSIPQVAAGMQTVLTTIADQAGRDSDFIVRESKLSGSTFVQTLVFGWCADAIPMHFSPWAALLIMANQPHAAV
jgi:hypothetical protein